MADRSTNIPGNQIEDDSITQTELDLTNIPTDGQIIKINMPAGDMTAIDLPVGGAEVNDLETDGAEGILTTEIPIGTGAGTANYKSLSGDATMTNAGVVSVVDLTIASQTAEDFLIFDGTNWVPKGGSEKIIVGSFTRDTSLATGTQAVTGLGFKPSAVIFISGQEGAAGEVSWGFDDGTNRKAIADLNTISADAYTMVGSRSVNNEHSSGNTYQGNISTFDATGFTMTWNKIGSPTGTLTIHFIAFR